ncbi:CD209 antigen-like isoform X1 [Sphaeramia orbicularis]|uniref:C-type lectin domain family 4 member M-like n=2 Tax=Sphaeramia orbicularis TaxID=375764 RepID=A0A672YT23_9TELE|nr:CD209 antigen-like isoform X1 [Sphaeramia orbicularis]
MSVEYRDSTVTSMSVHDSGTGYKRLILDSNKLQHSVHSLRQSPFKVATVCLGVLCVGLLVGVIGQTVHYRDAKQDYESKLKGMNEEKESLQQDVRSLKKRSEDLQANKNQLQQRYNTLSKRKEQIEINNNLLTEERNKVKVSESQLQATNTALNAELERLKDSTGTLQSNNAALTTAQNLLQQQYDQVVRRKKELQSDCDTLTRDRNNLQNRLNNVTRAKEQLQKNYNTLVTDVEHLQGKFNLSSSQKEKLESSHQNLTLAKDALQSRYELVVKARDELQKTYDELVEEKTEVERNCRNVTEERDLLKEKNNNLTAERDQLEVELRRLNTTVADRTCPSGWRKFQFSCYYISTSKKKWKQSRDFCKGKGAHLAIITSQEEMNFINGLFQSDKEVWIGLTDEGVEGHWVWVDRTPLTTAFWGKGQPNSFDGRNQDCVEFWHKDSGVGDWNDEDCNIEQYFLCEM